MVVLALVGVFLTFVFIFFLKDRFSFFSVLDILQKRNNLKRTSNGTTRYNS
jgi:hypothetical protein